MNPCRFSFFRPATAAAISLATLAGCGKNEDPPAGQRAVEAPWSPYHAVKNATHTGAESCRECHPRPFADWLQSDHHRAMQPATPDTVLGDFGGVEFEHFGHRTRFYRKDDEFRVNTEGPGGERTDYRIDYTFGFYPLQQYLIAFPGGRYQALQICWDSRPAGEGGQRWYHLYPDEEVPPDDVLHWTKLHFNWNYMCADCHSTDLRKNFDADTKTYATAWSEMNVSCEACHGPGSEHIAWAQAQARAAGAGSPAPSDAETADLAAWLEGKGLAVTLSEPELGAWFVDPATGQPKRTVPLKSAVQVETCARCHAHRQLLEKSFVAGQPFHDTHAPSILSAELYEPDGQIKEEVYVYGSFVQSKMFHRGVRCTDCHHPHTMKTLATGNALCVRCHLPAKYDSPAHHFHQPESAGAQCVDCHMPTKNYMVVDARRDHSIRIPRPDLSKKLGTPNACNQCHTDKDVDWAVAAFDERWGKTPRNVHYGEILAAARDGVPGSADRLMALASDPARPGLVRATAVSVLGQMSPSQPTLQAIAARLDDADPMVRVEALSALESVQPAQRLQIAAGLLADRRRAVRAEAARVLASAAGSMTPDQRAVFDRAAAEFLEKMDAIADRAAGHMGRALFYADLGRTTEAEAAYRKAFDIEPDHVPSRVNLAEMLYNQGNFAGAEELFRAAVAAADTGHSRGLAHDALARYLIRLKRYDEGLAELASAAELLPDDPRAQYFYGVALNSLNRFDEALPYLQKARDLAPNHAEYLVGLATVCRDAGRFDEAMRAAEQLARLDPGDPQTAQLLEQIRQLRDRSGR